MLLAFRDTLASALRTLGAHKLRSALTLLGIVIGVLAVVAMAATTTGMRTAMHRDMSQLGTGVFQVQKWPHGMGGGHRNWAKIEKRKNFTVADVELLQQHCQTCLRVAGEAWEGGQRITADDKHKSNVQVAGGTAEFFENNGYGLASGRFFSEGEAAGGAPVAVIGADVVDVLFPGRSPLGQELRVRNQPVRVIGTIERRGSSFQGSIDNLVVIPLASFLLTYGQRQSLNVTIMARDPERIGAAQDEVIALLRKARGVPPQEENDFELFSNRSVQDRFDEMTGSIAAASIGICAIALLIGGIGVMNIMLVAVTERTSEIGVRRALGARRRRILGQFVAEAIMLTSVGGALGVVLGAFVAFLIKVLVGLPTEVPTWAIVVSMLTAGATGLIFGIYPAWRASRLDPFEPMRHE
jgi:putative ABC transport system permease protein